MVLAFFKWCEASALGKGISGSVYLFPVVEAVHLLALAVIGGAVLIVDMRLAGLGLKKESAAEVATEAEPWLIGSLTVMLISGFMLMCSEAMRCYYNGAFWIKMYSLLGAVLFTFTIRRRVAAGATAPGTSAKLILVALISVLLWSGVGLGGRGIGFY